jgi:hypothetical protein
MPHVIFDVATAVDDGDGCLLDVDLFFDINNGYSFIGCSMFLKFSSVCVLTQGVTLHMFMSKSELRFRCRHVPV